MVEVLEDLAFCFMVCVVEVCLVFSPLNLISGVLCCFAVFDLWFVLSYYRGSLISWGCFAYWFVISFCVEDCFGACAFFLS